MGIFDSLPESAAIDVCRLQRMRKRAMTNLEANCVVRQGGDTIQTARKKIGQSRSKPHRTPFAVMRFIKQVAVLAGAFALSSAVTAFQIGPMGSAFESRLTNESESALATAAGKLGILIKGRVHEEITQVGIGCPMEVENLAHDLSCSHRDLPYASAFIIYGVRWNDLPPFKMTNNEGGCPYLGKLANPEQTIRFSTQPIRWICLFKDAEKKARTQRIADCSNAKGSIKGNLMTRSHFGDLQFLHAMSSEEGIHPGATRAKILDWLEFAWKVSSREIKHDTFLKDIDNPTFREHFGCSGWRVSDIYILGHQDKLLPHLHHVAFGSVLHTVQDSFAKAHASREPYAPEVKCRDVDFAQPRRIVEFHTYGAQDGTLHDEEDNRAAMTRVSAADKWPDAVEATKILYRFHEDRAKWEEVEPYMQCLFELADERNNSSPGELYRRRQ